MSLFKKILNHSFWLLIGNSIGRLSMFMTNIVAARLLPQEIFGQFMMVRSTISSIEGILSGALGSPIIKRVSEIAHEDKQYLNTIVSALFFSNLLIAIILGTILYLFSTLLVAHFFIGESLMISGLQVGALLLIATTLSNSMQSILTGFEEFKKLAFAGILASIASFPLIVGLIYYFGFLGAIWGVILYFTSDFVWKYFQIRKIMSLSWSHGASSISHESKKLLKFSTPLLFSVVIVGLSFWYARVIVVEATGSFEDIAIFDAAYQWLTIILIITSSITSVTLPMLSKSKNNIDSNNIFFTNFFFASIISVFIAFIFIFFSKEIMSIYGSSYVKGYQTLIILSISSIFFTFATLFNRYMVAMDRLWVIFTATILSSITLFIFLIFQTQRNAEGLSISILSYYLMSTLIYTIFFKKRKNYFV